MNEALLLIVIIGAVGITAIARSKGVQAGLVIVVIAGAISFLPGLERLELEPELILSLVMPPLLYSAALNFSFFSFLRNLRPIVGLGLGLVLVTAAAVTGIAAWLLPGLGVAGALVLAATVSPPDTVTTVTHGKELGLSKKVIAILTGESLVNDATALALFAFAVSLAAGTETIIENPFWLLVYGVLVGILVGLVLVGVAMFVRRRVANPTLETVVGLLLPFAAFLVAEQLHASGVMAVVIAGFVMSMNMTYDQRTHSTASHLTRVQERNLWPVVDLLLESFVFAYIGLQLRFVIEDLIETHRDITLTVLVALLVLVVVMAVRVAYTFLVFSRTALAVKARERRMEADPRFRAMAALGRRRRASRGRGPRREPIVLHWKERLVVGWTGMRGIVTLAAAGAVPATTAAGEDFPGRAQIQFIAFVVAIGTLVIQGATLPLLSRSLRIDTASEDAEAAADLAAAEAAAVGPTPEAQRQSLAQAVAQRTVTDEAAREMIHRIDLRQAADEASRGEGSSH